MVPVSDCTTLVVLTRFVVPPAPAGLSAETPVATSGGKAGCCVSPATCILRKVPLVAGMAISKNGFTAVGGVTATTATEAQAAKLTLGFVPTNTWKLTPAACRAMSRGSPGRDATASRIVVTDV